MHLKNKAFKFTKSYGSVHFQVVSNNQGLCPGGWPKHLPRTPWRSCLVLEEDYSWVPDVCWLPMCPNLQREDYWHSYNWKVGYLEYNSVDIDNPLGDTYSGSWGTVRQSLFCVHESRWMVWWQIHARGTDCTTGSDRTELLAFFFYPRNHECSNF